MPMTYMLPPNEADIGQAWANMHTTSSGAAVDPDSVAYQARTKAYAGLTDVKNFWLVVALPGDNYSEKITWHDDAPMLVPVSGSGTLLGISRSSDERK